MIRKSKFHNPFTPQYLYFIDTDKNAKYLAHLQIVPDISEVKHTSTNFDINFNTSKSTLITFLSITSDQTFYKTEGYILTCTLQVHLINPQRCSSLLILNWYSSLDTKKNLFSISVHWISTTNFFHSNTHRHALISKKIFYIIETKAFA